MPIRVVQVTEFVSEKKNGIGISLISIYIAIWKMYAKSHKIIKPFYELHQTKLYKRETKTHVSCNSRFLLHLACNHLIEQYNFVKY